MRVTVPTVGNSGLDDQIAGHFGMAPTYTIIDTETEEVRVVPNTSGHMGGQGHPPDIIMAAGADVVLCGNLGGHALVLFERYGIQVFVGASGTVRDALEQWQEGLLQSPKKGTTCEGHGCGHNHH